MSKYLVVVESPAKAKTINKYLGKDYTVVSSFGHVRDLPEDRLGVNIRNGFQPEYVILPKAVKVVNQIKKEAKSKSLVLIASDPDREGEAIGWHISEILKPLNKPVKRITFNAITERAVKEAIQQPREVDLNLVNAQQARRILDRLVGYKLSPLVQWSIRRGLSAGRVQSVAVRLVCEREEEIRNFIPREYWTIEGIFTTETKASFSAKLIQVQGAEPNLPDGTTTQQLIDELKTIPSFEVTSIEEKEVKRNPLPPFITSTMQQEASRKLKFAPEYTMRLAQDLYEGMELGEEGSVGLITYMRTDSLRVEPEAIIEARQWIEQKFGEQYRPEKPTVFRSKKGAQDAHEAIRPTSILRTPDSVKPYLSEDHYKLYTLIWQRFVASQMSPAVNKQLLVDIEDPSKKFLFRTTETTPIFPGFTALYDEEEEDTNGNGENNDSPKKQALPLLRSQEKLTPVDFTGTQHFTKPPARYTEASLIRALEDRGIGRPSTYAPTMKTIRERGYVMKEKGRLIPTPLGEEVNRWLVRLFPDILDYNFTANMEKELDEIEDGKQSWQSLIEEFYRTFQTDLVDAQKSIVREIFGKDVLCEKCNAILEVREGRYGFFLACPNFPDCKFTKPLPKVVSRKTDKLCVFCQKPLLLRYTNKGSILLCSGYPNCKAMYSFDEKGELTPVTPQEPIKTGETCPQCGGDIVLRKTKSGEEFYGCANYPKCRFTKPKELDLRCPRNGCVGTLQWRRSKRGRFLGCSQYPECELILNGEPQRDFPCPKCHISWTLLQKKRGGRQIIVCPNPDCGYQADIESNENTEII